ncbi:coenzyme F420 hydrogenase/dehydrogenase beta subunit N-terminal domain-containing protein [Thomasclavelia cocleata]|uniref:coenzyme F420 hydrogenase/dehydrogenase beta subunit N-terminal domain-containing protein n=1 Tax=Thomasclavelia cocleata TaxID=69824 RepID=UPI00272E257B|nr:coenzyme F420 hydrogenase/dehydrogenase beta subunit N-terminal domain-containing protein [Thomasclavelia cocleata]
MTYAGYSLSDDEIKSSSSGGLAITIARSFIKNNGIVYGVCYSGDFEESLYWCTNNEEDLEKFKTSKYAQSRKYNVYKNIYEKLKNGKKYYLLDCHVMHMPCDFFVEIIRICIYVL